MARQLVARGALDVAVENHGELVPTEAARDILKGTTKVMLREDSTRAPATPKRADAATGINSGDPLFEALRAWRRETALAQGVPAYVVFDDRTLAAVVAHRPRSIDALLEVPGIGRSRAERYGAALLAILARVT